MMQTHHILHFKNYSNFQMGKSLALPLPQCYRLAVTLFQAFYIKSSLFSNLAFIDRLVNNEEVFGVHIEDWSTVVSWYWLLSDSEFSVPAVNSATSLSWGESEYGSTRRRLWLNPADYI